MYALQLLYNMSLAAEQNGEQPNGTVALEPIRVALVLDEQTGTAEAVAIKIPLEVAVAAEMTQINGEVMNETLTATTGEIPDEFKISNGDSAAGTSPSPSSVSSAETLSSPVPEHPIAVVNVVTVKE